MPPALVHDLTAESVKDYVALFGPGAIFTPPGVLWYRGDGELRGPGALLPSIARPPSTTGEEWSLYQRFLQRAAAYLPHNTLTEWDWMLYMRHYGERTRLLDWTESPLVALYFAVETAAVDDRDGVVWCLDPERLNELAGFSRQLYCASLDTEFDVYTPRQVRDAATAKYGPVALIAPRSFPRLTAQQGVFTVIHREPTALDTINDNQLLSRIKIPSASKASMRAALQALGINRLSLYPELQSVSGMA